MTKETNIWKKIWALITELLGSLIKTQNSNDQQLVPSTVSSASQTIKDFVKDEAKTILEEKAAGLALSFGSMLGKLTPVQREYVKKIAILKAAQTTELTFDEILELGEILNQAQKLQITITSELSGFWSKVNDIAKEVAIKTGQVGFKLAARSLVGFLPI